MSVVIAMGTGGGFHPGNTLHVFVARVEPLHGLQDAGGTGLHGKMHMIAQRRIGIDRVDNRLRKVPGMRCGKAHTADAGDAAHLVQQRGKIPACGRGIAVAVHVLANELDLRISGIGELCRFANHRGAGAASLGATRERDYHNTALDLSSQPSMMVR